VVFAVASPVVAALTETWERRVLLGIGMAVFLTGTILQATAAMFPVMLIGSVLGGLGAATYTPTAYSIAGLLSDSVARARSIAVVMSGASLALVVGVPLTIRVGQSWGVAAFALDSCRASGHVHCPALVASVPSSTASLQRPMADSC